jgi:hypothetical protein
VGAYNYIDEVQMKKLTGVLICFLGLISCEKKYVHENEIVERQQIEKSEKNVSERFLRIDGHTDTLRNYELGKDLYGKFFRERAEFYIIEEPNKTIYSRPVKSITLYFLDGMLAKTKYELDDDISNELIQSYGNFTVRGYDTLTRRLVKSKKIIDVIDNRKVLNKRLINYQLMWNLDSKFIYTRVDKSGPRKRFEYIESLKEYETKYRSVQSE